MPDSGWIDCAGFDRAAINGGSSVTVNYVVVKLDSITNPRVRMFGTVYPKRLLYAGSFQLLTADFDLDNTTVVEVPCFDFPASWEMFEFDVPLVQAGNNACEYVAWQLPGGVSGHVKVVYA